MHEVFINWVLGQTASLVLSFLAFTLMLIYLIQISLMRGKYLPSQKIRKDRLIMRAINWGIFAFVFLLFSEIVPLKDIRTWRATSRVALFFLMLPEMAYQLTVMWPNSKRKLRELWNKA